MDTNTKTGTCGKCDGKGTINAFAHVAKGVCFQCEGTGRLPYRAATADRARLIAMLSAWLNNPATLAGADFDDAETTVSELIRRAPSDVAARALAAVRERFPLALADAIVRRAA